MSQVSRLTGSRYFDFGLTISAVTPIPQMKQLKIIKLLIKIRVYENCNIKLLRVSSSSKAFFCHPLFDLVLGSKTGLTSLRIITVNSKK